MKTALKILGSVIGTTMLFGMPMPEAQAGGHFSIGFGYRSGCRPHAGVGYSFVYASPRVYYVPAPRVVYVPPPAPPPVIYSQPAIQPVQAPRPGQPMGIADVKALAQAGVSDEVIISQIRNSGVVYRLTTAEILELHDAGVSQRVIDFMINTPSR